MIYKGIHQKHPWLLEFSIVLIVSFIVSSVLGRFIGIDEESMNIWLAFLFSSLLKITCFLLFGFIYYKLIKKKSNFTPEENED
ncbi:MAG: quinol-cytochrome oxidoreductase complex cytochrome b subunit [Urechidicola sp.]|jgi:quinol-cytochrome oxidoreductase complex cytochrome b subunit|tara:strand:+ start:695 stop:943 length:249 start_codon:yes stop_codon:yes gene_type:complete